MNTAKSANMIVFVQEWRKDMKIEMVIVERDNKPNLTEKRLRSYILLHFRRNPNRLFPIKAIMKKYELEYMKARQILLDMEHNGHLLKYEYGANVNLFVFNKGSVVNRKRGFF